MSSDGVGRRDVPPLDNAANAAFDDADFEDICECTIFSEGCESFFNNVKTITIKVKPYPFS